MLLPALAVATGLQAQTSLNIKTIDGKQTVNTISSIRKLTFTTGSVEVTKQSGTPQSYPLSSVRYLSFTNQAVAPVTEAPVVDTQQGSSLTLYPNPATNSINISYSFEGNEQANVTILDVEGRELLRTKITANDVTQLPLGNLQPGLYLCKVQTDKESVTQVFTKQ